MKHTFTSLLICIVSISILLGQLSPYEQSGKTETATYDQAIRWYQDLDAQYDACKLLEYGKTDVGKKLHLFVISKEEVFEPEAIRARQKSILMVNNAIHAGEPCGVDASMMLVRDLLTKAEYQSLLEHTVLIIIPMYNIGGVLNRGAYSRANQQGPKEHGFRGNARNYDLNRDFIKADTRNAQSFTHIFQTWLPDVFIDTHTTNGADYPAVLTYINTLPQKLAPPVADFMTQTMIPELQTSMDEAGIPICPYVYSRSSPDQGIAAFLDLPRYSSGYTALFQTMSFITEAHMLKSFEERVEATYAFLQGMLVHMGRHHVTIRQTVAAARLAQKDQTHFDLAWELDTDRVEELNFKGYSAKYKKSEISGQDRLYYDQSAPYEQKVPYFPHYQVSKQLDDIPTAYIIPQSQVACIDRLQLNQVEYFVFPRDTLIEVEVYYIEGLESSDRSYEGHFMHRSFDLRTEKQVIQLFAGDLCVFTNQMRNPYLVHVLEPEAQDAFFRWNFFDGILMRKEYFSPYVFEETAQQLLEENPELRTAFEERKASDSTFSASAYAQLNFIYQHSAYYEKTHNRYPIFRYMGPANIPVVRP